MTYPETLEYLFSQTPVFQNIGADAYKPGLETTLALSEYWRSPHLYMQPCVHIAGTNGKGTTAHAIASVLQASGYKVGLYTSPHLLDFRERIKVNGEPIPEQEVVDFVERYLANEDLVKRQPSFFELTTIMAFDYFVRSNVSVAVIEVGLGGRLDSTNIVKPAVTVITSISLDHTALLGNTEAQIAAEKAGIIKPGVPVVIGPMSEEARDTIQRIAKDKNAPLIDAAKDKMPWDFIKYVDTTGGLKYNAATILHALKALESNLVVPLIHTNIEDGLSTLAQRTGLRARWEEVPGYPFRIICDMGHNPGAWAANAHRFKQFTDNGHTLWMILGFAADKDLDSIAEYLPEKAQYCYTCPSVRRGRPAQDTAACAAAHGRPGEAFDTVREAWDYVRRHAKPEDTVFVGGSTFVAADFLSIMEK